MSEDSQKIVTLMFDTVMAKSRQMADVIAVKEQLHHLDFIGIVNIDADGIVGLFEGLRHGDFPTPHSCKESHYHVFTWKEILEA